MKICLIGPSHPFRGGISHYTTLLYRHLRKRHDIIFFGFKRQYPKWLFPGKTDLDPSRSRIAEDGVLRLLDSMNPLTWLMIGRKIIQASPDLLIIPWWVSFWAPQFFVISWCVKRFSRTKILFLCHNIVAHESRMIDKMLTRCVLNSGDLFIVHSNEDKQNLLSINPSAMVTKAFHPTYDVFGQYADDSDRMDGLDGISENMILFFGFVRPYKGLSYLIKALPEVIASIDVSLVIVGEFWENKDKYSALIKKLGLQKHVIIIDKYIPNEEVGRYFERAALVVQPYTTATGSGVIQMAFGFHTPVIATTVGCLPDVVKDGHTGFLVPPKDTRAIADAILKFFNEEKSLQFIKNIKIENELFSWDKMVDLIETLMN